MTRGFVAGVDACPGGWVAVFRAVDGADADRVAVVPRLLDVLEAPERPAIVAVDIPIGLTETTGRGGRAAEAALRPLLGARQSSVFSTPSRAAVHAADYAGACAEALRTSDPPRRVSRQSFGLFPRIREADGLIASHGDRLFETHPEAAFLQLAGRPAQHRKITDDGFAERAALLAAAGLAHTTIEARVRGAKRDDIVDAAVCALVAGRILAGTAVSWPPADGRATDGYRIAIWA